MLSVQKEFSLKIIKIQQETEDTKSIVLDLGDIPLQYKAGQYIVLELDVDEPNNRKKPLSIASSPSEKGILMLTTKITDTPYKQKFNSLAEGDSVKITGAFGKFTLDESVSEIVMLGGGIGITPFRSIIKYATDIKLPANITLFYSNKTTSDIVYKDEWYPMEKQTPNFRVVNIVTIPPETSMPWEGKIGRINEGMIREYIKNINVPVYYICGPSGMIEGMLSMLKMMNIMEHKIRIERFTGY